MRWKLAFQVAVLLALGQGGLGGIGYLTRELPWLGLPLSFVMVWFILRTVRVMKGEAKRPEEVIPWSLSLVTLFLWQLPTIATLPFWNAPEASVIWQGAVLPLVGTLGYWWSPAQETLLPWLWTVAALEGALFVIAARPRRRSVTLSPMAAVAAARQPAEQSAQTAEEKPKPEQKEWVPARRHKDIKRKGKKMR